MTSKSLTGIGTAARVRDIDQVHQQARALDVAEKLRAEAGAFVGAFDQAGDVGDDEADFVFASPTATTPRFGCRVVNG